MRLQAHALIVACLAVQYSSILFPDGSRMASVIVESGLGSLLSPKRMHFQAIVAVFNLP